MSPRAGFVNVTDTNALVAGIRDNSATVEMKRVLMSVDQEVNRIVC